MLSISRSLQSLLSLTRSALVGTRGHAGHVVHQQHDQEFKLDSLEPRVQMAADMAVTVTDPVLEFSRRAQDFVIKSDVQIRNIGDEAYSGAFRLILSLSTDTTVGNDYTVYDRTYSGTFKVNQRLRPDIAIPMPHDLLGVNGNPALNPGDYRLRAFIFFGGDSDGNAENNNVFSQGTFPLSYTWGGTGEGRNRSVLQTVLRTEQSLRFEIDGPGRGSLDVSDGRIVVNLFDTTAKSSLWITVGVRGSAAVINGLVVNGSLRDIRADGVSINGNLTITGSLTKVTLTTLANSAFSIGEASRTYLTANLGTVVNASLDSATPIRDIKVNSWTNNDGNTDVIVAPIIGHIRSDGAFSPNLVLSGDLGRTNISGSVSGVWDVVGKVGTIRIASPTDTFRINASERIDSLTVNGTMRGKYAAPFIRTIKVNGDVANVSILSGTDLGSDGELGGTGSARDSFSAGSIGNLHITGNVTNTAITASANPGEDALFLTGDDTFATAAGHIRNVRVDGTVTGSFFIAPEFNKRVRIGGVTIITAVDDRFRDTVP